jgi:hypothetical protein
LKEIKKAYNSGLRRVDQDNNNDSDREEKNKADRTIDNGDKRLAGIEDGTVINITRADNVSKDILDITDTPDVAVWNKSVQIKGKVVDTIKQSKENGNALTIGIGLKKKKHEGDRKDSTTLIDPANQKDVDEAINSGSTITDKA